MKLGYKILIFIAIILLITAMFYSKSENEIAVNSPSTIEKVDKTAVVEEDTNEDTSVDTKEDKKEDELDIFVATDIHYLSKRVNDMGIAFQKMADSSDGRAINYSEELVDAFTYNIIEKEPEVLIISGDLTHNGEKASHEDMAKRLEEIENSGTEVFVIPGNHDINNPWARAFVGDKQEKTETVTPDEFEEIYKEFGYSDYISRDEESLSYLSKANDEVWVLMLDTSMYENNTTNPVTNGRIKGSTLEWIKKCSEMAKENDVQIVTAMHHNLYNHSDLLNRGFTLDNSTEAYDTFKEAGLNIVLSGHIHIQDIKVDEENAVHDIVTSSLIVYPQQYGKITYNNDNGFAYRTERVDVDKWAKEMKINDENLLNFSTYAREFFYEKSYEQTYNQLSKSEKYTDDEAKAMATTMAELNVNYFAGTSYLISEDIINSEGYKLWEAEEENFMKYYIISMAKTGQDFNYVLIPKQVRVSE